MSRVRTDGRTKMCCRCRVRIPESIVMLGCLCVSCYNIGLDRRLAKEKRDAKPERKDNDPTLL